MQIVLSLDIDDILFYKIGKNYAIKACNQTIISFTKEALDELIKDYQSISKED